MAKYFLQYIKKDVAKKSWETGFITNSGSDQFSNKVNVGDIVWLVTRDDNYHIILLGKIKVAKICNREEATAIIGREVWKSDHHIISDKNITYEKSAIDITDIASQLSFISKTSTILLIENGKINFQALQTLRELEQSSDDLLNKKLFSDDFIISEEIQGKIKNGQGYGSPEENKKIEKAAIDFVKEDYIARGYTVKSVESLKLGYDLECLKEDVTEQVEVKGIRGAEISFFITENEVNFANQNSSFVLCVVTNALDSNISCHNYTADEFNEKFIKKALVYRCTLKSKT